MGGKSRYLRPHKLEKRLFALSNVKLRYTVQTGHRIILVPHENKQLRIPKKALTN